MTRKESVYNRIIQEDAILFRRSLNMFASDTATSAKTLLRLLSLGFLLVCAVGLAPSNASAGCGYGHVHYTQKGTFSSEARPGELPLKLYVQYVNGSISFTLTPPTAPCDGLSCNSNPKIRPVGVLPWTLRFSDSTNLRNLPVFVWGFASEAGRMAFPISTYAPRGGLQPPEHPPKSVLA